VPGASPAGHHGSKKQVSLDLSLSVKKTRKREFLEQMDKVVPWQALIDLIAPYCPEGKKGRPP
jgi:IS5 family transposase